MPRNRFCSTECYLFILHVILSFVELRNLFPSRCSTEIWIGNKGPSRYFAPLDILMCAVCDCFHHDGFFYSCGDASQMDQVRHQPIIGEKCGFSFLDNGPYCTYVMKNMVSFCLPIVNGSTQKAKKALARFCGLRCLPSHFPLHYLDGGFLVYKPTTRRCHPVDHETELAR